MVALVRVPFYFINLLPTSLLYICILLVCVCVCVYAYSRTPHLRQVCAYKCCMHVAIHEHVGFCAGRKQEHESICRHGACHDLDVRVGRHLQPHRHCSSPGTCPIFLVSKPLSLALLVFKPPAQHSESNHKNVWRMLQAAESVLVIGTQFHNLCTAVDKHQPCDTNRSE